MTDKINIIYSKLRGFGVFISIFYPIFGSLDLSLISDLI